MSYIPKQGDIIFIDFDPQVGHEQAGHEQAGHRPALVVSDYDFNEATKLAIVCPITNTLNDRPYRHRLPEGLKTTGMILCEQVKSLDINKRKAYFHDEAPNKVLQEVLEKIKLFF